MPGWRAWFGESTVSSDEGCPGTDTVVVPLDPTPLLLAETTSSPRMDPHIHWIHRNLRFGEKIGRLLEPADVVAVVRIRVVKIRTWRNQNREGTRKPDQILPPGDSREISGQLGQSINRDAHPRICVGYLLFGLHYLESVQQCRPTAGRTFLREFVHCTD